MNSRALASTPEISAAPNPRQSVAASTGWIACRTAATPAGVVPYLRNSEHASRCRVTLRAPAGSPSAHSRWVVHRLAGSTAEGGRAAGARRGGDPLKEPCGCWRHRTGAAAGPAVGQPDLAAVSVHHDPRGRGHDVAAVTLDVHAGQDAQPGRHRPAGWRPGSVCQPPLGVLATTSTGRPGEVTRNWPNDPGPSSPLPRSRSTHTSLLTCPVAMPTPAVLCLPQSQGTIAGSWVACDTPWRNSGCGRLAACASPSTAYPRLWYLSAATPRPSRAICGSPSWKVMQPHGGPCPCPVTGSPRWPAAAPPDQRRMANYS